MHSSTKLTIVRDDDQGPVTTDRGLIRLVLGATGRDGPMVAGLDPDIMGE